VTTRFRKAGVHATYLQVPDKLSIYWIEMVKEQGANKLLTNCPPCILSVEQGLELMRKSGEPVECGIFDFYKVFSRAFGEGEEGVGGT